MIRFYLVPVESSASGTERGPKYFRSHFRGEVFTPLVNTQWQARDYGNEPSMLVAAEVSDADDATLSALGDVTKFADNLDTQLGARLASMQPALEALNLPAQMLSSNTTDRQVVRGIMAIFAVAQCMQGKGFRIFGAAVTLATTMGSLNANVRQALQDCAANLKYDISGITLASTVRQVLSTLVQQSSPSPMMGVTV